MIDVTKIDHKQFQREIGRLERDTKPPFPNFEALCEAASKVMPYDVETIRAIVIHYDTLTMVKRPKKEAAPVPPPQKVPTPTAPAPEAKGAGKGRMQCPKCSSYVGVRTKTCDCGHVFVVKVGLDPTAAAAAVDKARTERRQRFEEEAFAAPTAPAPTAPAPAAPAPAAPAPAAPRPEKPLRQATEASDKGGQGRKQCPACQKYVGSLCGICVCGHVFEKKEKAPVTVATYDKPGPGLKECSGCGKFVGIRVKTCACGRDLHGARRDEPDSPNPEEVHARPQERCRNVGTPAGKPPVKLEGTTRDEVYAWGEEVRSRGFDEAVYYLPSALKYWVRYFYDIGTKEHQTVCAHLQDIYGQEVAA